MHTTTLLLPWLTVVAQLELRTVVYYQCVAAQPRGSP